MPDQITEVVPEKTELESIGQSLAENLHKADNPLEAKGNEMFKAEPFFKEEAIEGEKPEGEVEAEVAKVEEVKPPVIEETPANTGIDTTDVSEKDLLEVLNGVLGNDSAFESVDEIKNIIEDYARLKSAGSELKELTQEERARIEVGRQYNDFGLYDRIKGIDTVNIAPKEALKQVYFLDNLGKNQQFLDKAFEKDFAKTYEDELDEEFSKMLLENNGQEAKQRIIEIQEDLKKLGQVSGSADPEEAKRAKVEEDNKWFADVDNVINKSDRVTYNLEDGLKINIVMDVKDKQTIQDSMDRPIDFMRSQLTDEAGNYDHEAIYEFVMRNFYFEQIIEEARKSGAAHREEKILKEKKNIVIEASKAGDAGAETKLSDQFASNWSKLINQ